MTLFQRPSEVHNVLNDTRSIKQRTLYIKSKVHFGQLLIVE